ncbi:thermonuclease family protein [Roseospira visakhapatnamensis]|uniref:Endonuclease YncB(Thermonuclease family) n=1 Tax=Roseospira visakhapatnamensis TaxID=390880 RepID=A0A7W6RDJ7_9PROT|nr:thermonuclease family protein [Roseospira visakhapatnamensis]MBB4266355.1 endonuclease YncB(thermonuclease family) [Roseospira visakhapatnamensis]
MRRPRTPTRRRVLALGTTAGLATPLLGTGPGAGARATPPAPGLSPAEPVPVAGVRDDGTLVLAGGETLALTAVRLPQAADLPRNRHGAGEAARVQAVRAEALTRIRAACRTAVARPWVPAVGRDRHGRLLAQVEVLPPSGAAPGGSNGRWLQADLIAAGLARVETMAGAAAGADRLLSLEARARRARRGLWADALYHPRHHDQTWPWIGTFQIVRGVVRDVALVRGRLYLNFGPDWRRDFTVMVERPRRTDLDPTRLRDLRAQLVQVRGWLFPTNGPMIALDHAAPLETRVWLD